MPEVTVLAKVKVRGFFQCSFDEAQGSCVGVSLWVSSCISEGLEGLLVVPFFWVFAGVFGWVIFVLFVLLCWCSFCIIPMYLGTLYTFYNIC
jgi:hypothetical protein